MFGIRQSPHPPCAPFKHRLSSLHDTRLWEVTVPLGSACQPSGDQSEFGRSRVCLQHCGTKLIRCSWVLSSNWHINTLQSGSESLSSWVPVWRI